MYTKEQLEVVQERVRKEGMAGLLQPPPLTTAEKLIRAVLIAAVAACATVLVYSLIFQ